MMRIAVHHLRLGELFLLGFLGRVVVVSHKEVWSVLHPREGRDAASRREDRIVFDAGGDGSHRFPGHTELLPDRNRLCVRAHRDRRDVPNNITCYINFKINIKACPVLPTFKIPRRAYL